ncbi:XisI protein [Phormidium yuhuli AB48]|uniref:XisI protein n=1 Tax=Phormidium yuhuli AB48 TaxID=2940671 RepID=A0ABY5AT43_9CYAN|nr:XisI protein [Phormidium yuhuli]USR92035.1 XisI protein [Phormidium yuhuli AB48]
MDSRRPKLDQYRQIVADLLQRHSLDKPSLGDIEVYYFADPVHDHYQVFHAGWNRSDRIFGPLIHIDILNDKIWIQYDGTEVGVANELVDRGIPKEEIVLAYHPPQWRHLGEFAVS